MKNEFYVHGINGPVVTVRGGRSLAMLDQVYVGEMRLVGEVVGINSEESIVQVYEDTAGLKSGEPVFSVNAPMAIDLGPGLLNNIFDGIARPLKTIEKDSGAFISKGINISSLDFEKKWDIDVLIKEGDIISGGMIFAECYETKAIKHRFLVLPDVAGVASKVKPSGSYAVGDVIAEVTGRGGTKYSLKLSQRWPIRSPRPVKKRLMIDRPLVTGQRIIDTLFPLGRGGCAAIPGPFGAGKTVVQHQLAKWSDADIIVYLGCGERGNEMTQALEEFSELKDPKSGRPLMERTILIANTSNMPVAAREASIYTGMTIAEYYRDMGYHVALMADSTSRWAEALREISGRLEEMPAEEGFPAYLSSRLAEFYERAGSMLTLSGKEGSVSVIGAVSPAGGDFSEPVTQNTKRFTRCFWALDRALAYARHFPSINWTTSYSEYFSDMERWYNSNVGEDFMAKRQKIISLLKDETSLLEIVKLIGSDVLPESQKLIIEISRLIRVGFLQQNAYHVTDAYMPLKVQLATMSMILKLFDGAVAITNKSIPLSQLKDTGIFTDLAKMKFEIGTGDESILSHYEHMIDDAVNKVLTENS